MNTNRTVFFRLLGLIAATLVLFVACGGEEPPADSGNEQVADATSEAESNDDDTSVVADDGVVVIEMFTRAGSQYNDPLGVHVEPGTTIRFINRTGTHTTTAYHPDNRNRPLRIPDAAEPWDSGVLTGRDAQFDVTLTVEGVYDYVCTLHEAQGHVGRIVVGDPDASPARGTSGLPGRAAEFLPDVDRIVAEGVVPFE